MNNTPPPLSNSRNDAAATPSGTGAAALAPLNARFVDYLDHASPRQQMRRQYVLTGLVTAMAILVAILSVAVALSGGNLASIGIIAPLGIVIAARGLRRLRYFHAATRRLEARRRIVQNGVSVTGYLVQANSALFKPGRGTLPCLVLFSFQPEVNADAEYMGWLARRVFALKNTTPNDRDGRTVAAFTTDERAVMGRRRRLPLSFTDGSTVYCADLWLDRAYLEGGYLTSNRLPCIAEPGEGGGIELVPACLVSDAPLPPAVLSRSPLV